MKVRSQLYLVASDIKLSHKTGKPYRIGLFTQGLDSVKLFIPDNVQCEDGQEYDAELEYNNGKLNIIALE